MRFAFANKPLLTAALAFAATTALAARTEDAVTLSSTVKKGETTKYAVTIDASLMGITAKVKNTMKHEVKEVKDNGQVVVELVDEGGTLTFGGMDQDAPPQPKMTETRDKGGKLISVELAGDSTVFSPEISKTLATLRTVILPTMAVKAGDSWTNELDNLAVKDKKIKLKSTFVGIEKVEDKEYHKLKQVAEVVMDPAGAVTTYEHLEWRTKDTGVVEKSETTMTNLPTAMLGPLNWTMKTQRVAK